MTCCLCCPCKSTSDQAELGKHEALDQVWFGAVRRPVQRHDRCYECNTCSSSLVNSSIGPMWRLKSPQSCEADKRGLVTRQVTVDVDRNACNHAGTSQAQLKPTKYLLSAACVDARRKSGGRCHVQGACRFAHGFLQTARKRQDALADRPAKPGPECRQQNCCCCRVADNGNDGRLHDQEGDEDSGGSSEVDA